MTVSELIAALAKMPPDATVVVCDSADGNDPTRWPVLCVTEYVAGEIDIEF